MDSRPRWRHALLELRRRKVIRVAGVYAATAFVVWQVSAFVLPALDFPSWSVDLVVVLSLLGFPVALVLAWAFEVTPDGVRRTSATGPPPSDGAPEAGRSKTRRVALLVGSLVVAAVAGSWYFALAGGEPGAESRSVAVLPFTNLGGDESTQLTRGIHDDLVTQLSRVSGLRVTSRTSVRQYAGTEKTVREIGRELGVGAVLEGGVQRAGDSVRINVTLVDAARDRPIWSESFDRRLTARNLFAIQAELTGHIAEALETELTREERERLDRPPTEDLEAYRLYVWGRASLDQRSEAGMRRALDYFGRAVEEDSTYALAWTGLADALYELEDYGFDVPDDARTRGLRAARRAVELEPGLAEAHTSLAMALYLRQEGPAALAELQRAIDLRASYGEAHNKLSWVAQQLGRPEIAFRAARRAVALDPLAPEPRANLSTTHLIRGETEQALRETRRMRELQTEQRTGRFYEGVLLHHMGRHGEAAALLGELSVPWAGQGPGVTLALARAASGDSAGARDLLSRLRDDGAHPFFVGLVLAALGERDVALETFRGIESWTTEDDWAILAARYFYPAVLTPLRDDPRYREMTARLNRAWGLGPDGSLPAGLEGAL